MGSAGDMTSNVCVVIHRLWEGVVIVVCSHTQIMVGWGRPGRGRMPGIEMASIQKSWRSSSVNVDQIFLVSWSIGKWTRSEDRFLVPALTLIQVKKCHALPGGSSQGSLGLACPWKPERVNESWQDSKGTRWGSCCLSLNNFEPQSSMIHLHLHKPLVFAVYLTC